jgi:hypothetical protein
MADRKSINPTASAVAGIVIGAAAGAAAIALSDKKNRQRVVEKAHELRVRSNKTLGDFKKKVNNIRKEASDTIEKQKAEAKKRLGKEPIPATT